ncbi:MULTISPECIES: two-component system sensor histidine kinase ChvG [Rhizobium/Agrobacterium group]|uniref:two-component system sensor histidine kinase ChvG n=1 Tax=Rhizobium/Agrobacterium group TaxID=227290 RepID=UPI0003F1DA94|nr:MULTISPECIES: two-component system sensor histidine kinase ChvG [Rhizobium/Agrobacterium group]AHJ99938.1 sensor histidine kinase ChvG [Agrobacterium tumefaciens LBA4213 (Ach5)]AKC05814.1 two component sensor kinase [Agrobacterium tumefaciens]AYM17366.1 two component sensor kinase [Agrobacterium tumefaciens]NTB19048.1 HAMP domain-containing protein [Agrobacterium tumefaciens]CUW96728.1 two component Sensor protein chvG (Histidine kinase sensory protein exoS) [Agrobacterium fabacearum TT111]
MLKKTPETVSDSDDAEDRGSERRHRIHPLTIVRRIFGNAVFSSLTRRILFFNVAATVVLVGGILYLNQFREGLIDARVESLLTQGEIIAGAISASASVDTNSITINPEKLLELQAGQSITPAPNDEDLSFPINPERVAPVLRRLISPTRTRARLFDADANLLLDSRHLYSRGQVLRFDLPPVTPETQTWGEWFTSMFNRMLQPSSLPQYKEAPGGDGSIYPEVMNALTGVRGAVVRVTEKGELIVSVAVPVQRFRAVLGVLLLSTQAGDIDKIVRAERLAIMRVFGIATLVNIVLSLLLSSTIATPLRRLSAAAIRVRRGARTREEIPDFSARQDEIGNLSIALREMTTALYDRIDAIESFAADVSHELKNPLTSLRSAVETLPRAKTEESKQRLTEIIFHDVRRLDRLISDISDASRLDAELARVDASPLDLDVLMKGLVDISRQISTKKKSVAIDYVADRKAGAKTSFVVNGHDLRIGQIVTNLIENARSFVSEESGRITVRLSRHKDRCIVQVEDNGPGIQAEDIDRIFERFYTDRPASEGFGQNSGLGLSISRQIAEAHGGSLRAENVVDKYGVISGARFTLSLPAAETHER